MIDKSLIAEDVEIVRDTVYAFPYELYDFTVEYSVNDEEWYAYHHNEEIYDEQVILEDKEFKFDVDILLFECYNLNVEEFENLKVIVEEDMAKESTNII